LLVTQNATTDVRFEQFIQCFGIIFGVDPGVIFSEYQHILEFVDPVTELRTSSSAALGIDDNEHSYTYNWITVQPDNTTMCGRKG